MAKKKERDKQMELLTELHQTMTDRQIASAIETTRERANDYRNGRIHMPDRYVPIIEKLIKK
jgi:hypothetical protein